MNYMQDVQKKTDKKEKELIDNKNEEAKVIN